MRYTRAGQTDVPRLRALWRAAFGDADESLDFFFDTVFPTCDVFAARDAEDICAMVFCLPQTLCLPDGHTVRTAYLYAVAVEEASRRQGICRALLNFTAERLHRRGVQCLQLAALTPALAGMYHKLGFTGSAHRWTSVPLPPPAGQAQCCTAAQYAGVRETLLMDVPHIRYDLPQLSLQARDAALYALQCGGVSGCAAVRTLPDGRLRLDELLPDARVLPALATVCACDSVLCPEAGFLTRWLDAPTSASPAAPYAAFAFD